MIVPSMSYAEMRNEFLHDYHIAAAKAKHTYRKLLFEMHRRKQNHAIETVNWKSPLHNEWMSFFSLSPGMADCTHVCITMDHQNLLKALSAMNIDKAGELSIAEWNIHFYKRYNERLKLNLPKPLLIVKHYFKHNINYGSYSELSGTGMENSYKFFLPVNGGVLLGYQYPDNKWLDIKTFISDEMLRESQMETVEFLKGYKL